LENFAGFRSARFAALLPAASATTPTRPLLQAATASSQPAGANSAAGRASPTASSTPDIAAAGLASVASRPRGPMTPTTAAAMSAAADQFTSDVPDQAAMPNRAASPAATMSTPPIHAATAAAELVAASAPRPVRSAQAASARSAAEFNTSAPAIGPASGVPGQPSLTRPAIASGNTACASPMAASRGPLSLTTVP